MPRGKKQQKKVCTDHNFSMKPIQFHKCYYQQSFNVKLCATGSNLSSFSTKNIRNCYQGPILNKDKNCSTPFFILASDKNSYLENACCNKQDNTNKFINYSDEKSKLFFPKPNSKNMYCSVCKERYEDYRNHILSEKHKRTINYHPFNRHILELQSKYQAKKEKIPKNRDKDVAQTTDYLDKVILILSSEQQCERQDYGEPRKLRKLQQKPIFTENQFLPFPNPPIPLLPNQFCQPPFLYPNMFPTLPMHFPQPQYLNNNMTPLCASFPQIQFRLANGMLGGQNLGYRNFANGFQPRLGYSLNLHNLPVVGNQQGKKNVIFPDSTKRL